MSATRAEAEQQGKGERVTVLPYIRIREPLEFAGWCIWPNTDECWLRFIGRDLRVLLDPYRDHLERPMGKRASVLSRPLKKDYQVFEARAAIAALSTLNWLFGDSSAQSAEPWFSETFPLPEPGKEMDSYVRPGKFVPVVARPSTDRVFPGLFLFPTEFAAANFRQGVDAIEQQLLAPRGSSVVGAMEHWHRARGESENHTGPFADVEALWSGFEAFFHFPKEAGDREKTLVERLRLHFDHLGLDENLFWAPLARWAKSAYETRCAHVHGADLKPEMLALEQEKLSVFHTGLKLAKTTMRLMILGGGNADDRARRDLRFLFCQGTLIDRAARLLKNMSREQIYPGTVDTEETVRTTASLLTDLMQFESWPSRFKNDNRLLKAADQIAVALSAWSKALVANIAEAERGNVDQLLSVISEHAKSSAEVRVGAIARSVADMLPAIDPYFGQEDHDEPDGPEWYRGGLAFWKWASGLRRLYEIWFGNRLT